MRTPLLSRPKTADPLAAPRSPYADRWWRASAAFLGLVLLLAGYVAFGGHDRARRADSPPAAVDAAPRSTPAPAAAGVCPAGLTVPIDSPPPQEAGPAATWRQLGRVVAPFSMSFGPIDGRCFEHSATGALFAAAHFLASATDPTGYADTLHRLAAPGPGRDDQLARLAADPATLFGGGSAWTFARYTFLSATPDSVTVAVVLRGAGGGYAAVPVTLVWGGDTWLVQLPADGNLVGRSTPLPSPVGYVPWSAP